MAGQTQLLCCYNETQLGPIQRSKLLGKQSPLLSDHVLQTVVNSWRNYGLMRDSTSAGSPDQVMTAADLQLARRPVILSEAPRPDASLPKF